MRRFCDQVSTTLQVLETVTPWANRSELYIGLLKEAVRRKLAEGAIDQNTQLCRNNADNALSRQFTTNDRMLRYKRIQSTFYSDTMFSLTHKSVLQFKCCQVFVRDKGFVAVYTMKSQKEF